MTLATGSQNRGRRATSAAGFTLVEILLTVALLGLLAGLCIAGTGMLAGGGAARSTDIFWQSVSEARARAVNTDAPVDLSVSANGRSFRIKEGELIRELALPENTQARLVLSNDIGRENSRLGSMSGDLRPIHFYRDGTCDAFQVEIQGPAGSLAIIPIDPWTCAAVLARPAATGL